MAGTKKTDFCYPLNILFSSNHNIHKSSSGLCFWASDPLVERFLWNLSINGSEAQKQRPCEFLWTLRFDEKIASFLTYVVQCTLCTLWHVVAPLRQLLRCIMDQIRCVGHTGMHLCKRSSDRKYILWGIHIHYMYLLSKNYLITDWLYIYFIS